MSASPLAASPSAHQAEKSDPPIGRIALASLVGTTIEFYDFYVYATAAALVIGPVFFPQSMPSAQSLNAFLTFGIAFLARPVGSAIFGHYGDRIGRKTMLVLALLIMGLSTTLIGVLPSYAQAGAAAPMLLCLMRLGQGIGLGGEWGGAALIATENAPAHRRAWFGMFPQLGPSVGFLMANGLFLALMFTLPDGAFKSWGWRIPFLASSVLVVIGLYIRISLTETAAFAKAMAKHEPVRMPLVETLRRHWFPTLLGAFAMVVCYALFYISTVFSLSYASKTLGIPRETFLLLLCFAVLFMAAATPISARLADRYGRRPVLIGACALAVASGFLLGPMLSSGNLAVVAAFLAIELGLMGATFAPMGALLPELFPTRVRYTGASAAYNLGGILGGSLAPYIAQNLAQYGGLSWVGYYISVGAALSLVAVFLMRETSEGDLSAEDGLDEALAEGFIPPQKSGAV